MKCKKAQFFKWENQCLHMNQTCLFLADPGFFCSVAIQSEIKQLSLQKTQLSTTTNENRNGVPTSSIASLDMEDPGGCPSPAPGIDEPNMSPAPRDELSTMFELELLLFPYELTSK